MIEENCKHKGWKHSQRFPPCLSGVHVMEWCDDCGKLLKDYHVPLPEIPDNQSLADTPSDVR